MFWDIVVATEKNLTVIFLKATYYDRFLAVASSIWAFQVAQW